MSKTTLEQSIISILDKYFNPTGEGWNGNGLEALLSLFEKYGMDVISPKEHEDPNDYPFIYGKQYGRNELRAEQTERLKQIVSGKAEK